MKLVLAIINHDDANTVTRALTKRGFLPPSWPQPAAFSWREM